MPKLVIPNIVVGLSDINFIAWHSLSRFFGKAISQPINLRGELLDRKNIDRFCNGLTKDVDALKNPIKYKWTNGLVEGNVNRLKEKREMYGRCRFE